MERPRPWHPFRVPGMCGLFKDHMYNDFVVSDNLLGNTTLHNRSEGVTNRRSDKQYDDTSSGSYSEMC